VSADKEKKEGPRDWDKELAEIDMLMASVPAPAPPAAAPTAGGQAVRRSETPAGPSVRPSVGPSAVGRRALLLTWMWFLLAGIFGAALQWWWPWSRVCGLPLYGYLGAIGLFFVASSWSVVQSWRTRSTVPHFLSIPLLFWAAALGATEVLPRIGYARQTGVVWRCPATPVAPPSAPTIPNR
jgi:hypothetical protein